MLDFTVKYDSGEQFEVTADSRDVVVFERTSKGRTLNDLIEGKSFTDMYRLAWIASKRQGLITTDLATFEKDAVLELGDDDDETEEADPTRTAA